MPTLSLISRLAVLAALSCAGCAHAPHPQAVPPASTVVPPARNADVSSQHWCTPSRSELATSEAEAAAAIEARLPPEHRVLLEAYYDELGEARPGRPR